MPESHHGLARLYVYYKIPAEFKQQALSASGTIARQLQSRFHLRTELQIRADNAGSQLTLMEAYLMDECLPAAEMTIILECLKTVGDECFSSQELKVDRHIEWFETVEQAERCA